MFEFYVFFLVLCCIFMYSWSVHSTTYLISGVWNVGERSLDKLRQI